MKPYKYTAELSGRYDTRHEAIGKATIAARERPSWQGTVIEAIERVYGYEPYICDICGETFLYESKLEKHNPCPQWEKKAQRHK